MNILLVEDDPKSALSVTDELRKHGHDVRWAATGADGLVQARNDEAGLAIVDRMLPVMDGLSLVKQMRADGFKSPILFLTTMGDVDNRVEGLNAGADDYLAKPFSLSELLARVDALLRRSRRRDGAEQTHLHIGNLEMDLLARRVYREGREIQLMHQEFRLLEYLMRNVGQVVTRAMLLEHVWDIKFDPRSNIVESHISRLRAKIDRAFSPDMIHTVRGAGYTIRA